MGRAFFDLQIYYLSQFLKEMYEDQSGEFVLDKVGA